MGYIIRRSVSRLYCCSTDVRQIVPSIIKVTDEVDFILLVSPRRFGRSFFKQFRAIYHAGQVDFEYLQSCE